MSNKGSEIMFPPASPYTERVRIACEQPPIQYHRSDSRKGSVVHFVSKVIARLNGANTARPREDREQHPSLEREQQCA
jgi:hypothetical protein